VAQENWLVFRGWSNAVALGESPLRGCAHTVTPTEAGATRRRMTSASDLVNGLLTCRIPASAAMLSGASRSRSVAEASAVDGRDRRSVTIHSR
jgi:hypothetical protein